MLNPVGGQASGIYWRRRLVVLGAVIVTIVLVKSTLFGGGSSSAATGTGSADPTHRPPAHPSSASPTPSASVSPGPAPGAATPTAPRPTPAPSPRPVVARPTPTPKPRPLPPVACPATGLRLYVGTAEASYRVNQLPEIVLTVANASARACRGDFGPGVQEALVYAGRTRLWSSNDCYPSIDRDVLTLGAGQIARFTVRWSRKTSRPGCAGVRQEVGPGSYSVRAKVGALTASGRLVLTPFS